MREGVREGGVSFQITFWGEVGRYGFQNDGLDEADTMARERGREGGGREEGREGGREGRYLTALLPGQCRRLEAGLSFPPRGQLPWGREGGREGGREWGGREERDKRETAFVCFFPAPLHRTLPPSLPPSLSPSLLTSPFPSMTTGSFSSPSSFPFSSSFCSSPAAKRGRTVSCQEKVLMLGWKEGGGEEEGGYRNHLFRPWST